MRWSVVASAEMRVTVPLISGVVRWLKAEKRRQRDLADLHLIDVLRVDLGLDRQVVGVGHDQHDRVAGGDDAADGMHVRLEHHAVLRRADVDALELVFGGDLALDELADLAVDLAHFLGDLAAQVLVDLDDLQFGLRDLAVGLGDCGDQLPALALEPRRRRVRARSAW